MNRVTEFSPDRVYRYTLWREWDLRAGGPLSPPALIRTGQYLMVIGLNPSTADETKDDPTIRRCIDFAKRWGFGALCMTNLFALRETKAALMKRHPEPVGPENNRWLKEVATEAGLILAAWGNHGGHLCRAAEICSLLRDYSLHCLQLNQSGAPMHPLFCKGDITVTGYPENR